MAKIAKKVVHVEGLKLTIEFQNGKTLSTDLSEFEKKILDRLSLHGLSQKLGDSYAGAASVDEAYLNASSLLEQLKSGVWAAKAQRGGIWVEALAKLLEKDFAECLSKWTALPDDERKKMMKHPDLMRVKAEIEAERARKLVSDDVAPIDFDSL